MGVPSKQGHQNLSFQTLMLRHMIFSGYANMKDKIWGYQNGISLLNGAAKIQTFKLLTLDR